MPAIKPKSGIPFEVQQGIESGRLFPDGGVIRDGKTRRIVLMLREASTEQDTLAECVRLLVPLVLHAAWDSRVPRVEAQLRVLAREIIQLSSQVRVAGAKFDGLLLGQILSTLQLMKMHLIVGEEQRAAGLWTEMYRDVAQLFAASEALLAQSDVMQKHVALWTAYSRVCWGAGVITLDLLIQQGHAGYAGMVARQLAERAEAFEQQLEELLSRPSCVDWLSLEHAEVLQEVREVKRRLLARRDALAQGLFAAVHALGEESPEAEAPYDAPALAPVHSPAG
jgi:hypothetical protein